MMDTERARILKLLEEGRITAAEADKLLDAAKATETKEAQKTQTGASGLLNHLTGSINVLADAVKRESKKAPAVGNTGTLADAADGLAAASDADSETLQELVKNHALSASISATGSAWMTGAGATIATTLSLGFVASLLWRINKELDVKLDKAAAKQVASSLLQSIAPKSAALYVAATGVSFIPVLGNIASDVIMTPICYSATFTAGVVYLKAITKVLTENESDTEGTDEEY